MFTRVEFIAGPWDGATWDILATEMQIYIFILPQRTAEWLFIPSKFVDIKIRKGIYERDIENPHHMIWKGEV